jgi:hypothetical protein
VAPPWLDEVRLDPGPPWLTMGTRAHDERDWLVVDERRDTELALKRRLLSERHDDVFAALPSCAPAADETLELVVDWLRRHDRPRPSAPSDEACHPLDHAGRLVQEDLCLMVPDDAGAVVLAGGSVCFPSHWRLVDKLGRPAAAIHAPVPHYDDELRDRVDRFLERLRPERSVQRRNLSVHNHDDLYAPEPHESPASFTDDPTDVWLRSERQTLRRLPRTGAVLFTIKTQQCRLVEVTDRPDLADRLAAKLAAIATDSRARGDEPPFPTWLPDWLRDR